MGKRMKNFLLIVLMGLLVILYGTDVFARANLSEVNTVGLAKMQAADKVTQSISNIGNWGFWLNYNGQTGHDPFTGSSGGYYPRGTSTAIYMDGVIWGGWMRQPATDDTIKLRVGGIGYQIGTVPGWINDDGTATDPDGERVRLYRIRADWATLTPGQVKQDAAEIYNVALANVTDAMIEAVINQYKEDWKNWPADLGAPYVDGNGNGVYDPTPDENGMPTVGDGLDYPGIANADQVLWIVTNDLNRSKTYAHSGAPPIGLELQVTLWAYNQPGAGLGQIVFKKYRLINKSGTYIDSMFIAQYSDPDVGDYSDDLVGCDVEKSLHFAYNGNVTDAEYQKFGLAAPSAGFDFFQGPLVKTDDPNDVAVFDLKYRTGYKNLPMTSFGYFAAGGDISDPPMGVYDFTLQWYNMLNGYIPTNDINNPTPFYYGSGPHAGEPTKFPASGDPVNDPNGNFGDIDGKGTNMSAGDRRMFAASGPFTMAPQDTQELVVALVGGMGSDNLSSITAMKTTDGLAQQLYDDLFTTVPKPPAAPKVTFKQQEGEVVLDWGSDLAAVAKTEADNDLTGYDFEGYVVYQLPTANSSIDDATRIATFDKINGVETIYGPRFRPEYGMTVNVPVEFGLDKGVQRYIIIDKDYITGKPLYTGKTYYFAVTAYNYNANPQLIQDKALESGIIPVQVVMQGENPGYELGSKPGDGVENTHAEGVAAASIDVKVVDPTKITGDSYEVYFEPWHFYMDVDGKWKRTALPDSVVPIDALGKGADVSPSTLSAIAYTSPTPGTRDIKFILDLVSPDYDWCDGISVTFPDGIVINTAEQAVGNGDGAAYTPVIDRTTNTVTWGSPDTSRAGSFSGGEVFTVNVNTPTLPLDVDYMIFDDGWGEIYLPNYGLPPGTVVHGSGTVTITQEAYAFKTVNTWGVKDVTTDEVKVEGVDKLYNEDPGSAQIVDGVQVAVTGSYAAPVDFTQAYVTHPDGTSESIKDNGSGSYPLGSYMMYGWAETARATATQGYGTSDLTILIQDYELRWTGEFDTTDVGGIQLITVKDGTGSMAYLSGARGYSLADHPLNPNPGTDAPFMVRIPFEVWNIDTGEQIQIDIYDRKGNPTTGEFQAWNPHDRMYTHFIDIPYTEEIDTIQAHLDMETWNLVWWSSEFKKGDKVTVIYPNPILLGVDKFAFSTEGLGETYSATKAAADVEKINVFPNPYYAQNSLEPDRFNRFVTFTHMPPQATVRIFNLAGVQVRKLEKNDNSSYFQWDLQNESQLPVASGMYIAHIDMPKLNKTKILKIMVIQAEQILEYY